jgi:alkaline phosphatase D
MTSALGPLTSRREFVAQLSAFSLALAGRPNFPRWLRPRFATNPFTLGVASGDPTPHGVVLWTRLAPDPLNDGGMPNEGVAVRWEVAADEGMTRVLHRGTATARPDLAHAVHAELEGLDPDRWYWYRFNAGGEESPVGRTRTAPAAGAQPQGVRFALASCQHYEEGLYTAYRHMAAEELDFVVHVGDYIYEYNHEPRTGFAPTPRHHVVGEPTTLRAYRNRYALYKTDRDLQAAHAHAPWIVTWDDHEVQDNYAGAISKDTAVTAREFLPRRAAAYQAYYEHQPLRKAAIPHGPDALMYRTIDFGTLARFHVLDTRQYRSDQACGDGLKPACPGWSDAKRTLMGETQERWLAKRMNTSSTRWHVLAQQVAFAPIGDPAHPEIIAMDPWSGYPAARERVTALIAQRRERDVVILSGDIHSNFVMDVKRDPRDEKSPTVAAEFIGTSISSGGDGRDRWTQLANYEHDVPSMKYHDGRRGYVTCAVTADEWHAAYRQVPFVTRPGAPVTTAASFVVQRGRPGAEQA